MIKSINKLCAALVLMSFISGALPAFAQSESNLFFYEDFNGYATNETKTSVEADNAAAYVKERSKTNKALEISAGIALSKIKAKWENKADKVVISLSIECENERANIDVSAANSKGREEKLIGFSPNGEIKTYDGKKIGGFAVGAVKKVAIAVDNINEVFSVYLNGKNVISDWNVPGSVVPEGIVLSVSGGTEKPSTVYVDDICVYPGERPKTINRNTKFNPETIELISVNESVGASIITKNDFSLPLGAAPANINELNNNMKSNLFEIMGNDENKYLHIEQTTTNDSHIDTQFTNDLNFLVMQADFKFDRFGSTIYPFNVRDNVSNVSPVDEIFGTIDQSGVLSLSNGKKAYTFKKGQWYNLAVAFNLIARTIDVYVDNKLIAEKMPIKQAQFLKPRMVRTWIFGSAGVSFNIDNYNIYEGVGPAADFDELEAQEISIMSDGKREQELLKNKTAICISNGLVYKDGVKTYMATPAEENNEYYVNRETAEALIGAAGAKYNDKIPLKAAAEENGFSVYENADEYLLVFSKQAFKADDKLMSDVSKYMKMQLPDAETIKKDFKERSEGHPRILATASDWDKIRKNIETYPEFAEWHKKIMAQADSKLMTATEYYHYEVQENILHPARRFKEKMLYWGYAWKITGNRKYVDKAVEEMKAVCEFPDWSPVHPLDTGELLFGSAIGYDWMYEALTDEQRKTIEEGTKRLGIDVLRSAYYGRLRTENSFGSLSGGNFVMSPTNFNVVVNGGLTAAALAYGDIYPDECFDSVSKAIQSLGYMLPLFEPSGGWEEGPNYWNYTTAYLANMVSALYSACGTDYGIMKHPGVSLTPHYAIYLDSFQGLNNFSDTSRGWSWDSPQFSLFGTMMNEPGFTYQRYIALMGQNPNASPTVFDMIWLDISQTDAKPELPLDNLTPGIDMVSMRENWDMSDAMNFGAHGGNNTAYHGHYDGGTWIFDILGERWAIDLGMDEKSYVGYSMNVLYRTRTEGHNMLVFNPSADPGFNNNSYTPVIRYETKPKGGIVVYDNSEGYKAWTNNVTRGFYIGDERRSLTVRDEFTVNSKDTEVYWSMHTPADITIDGNNAILSINGKQVLVEFASDIPGFEILSLKAEPLPGSVVNNDIMAKDPDINKLCLHARVSGSAYIEAKLSALGEPASKSGMLNAPISTWEIPDGELIKRGDSALTGLTVNGEPLAEFKPNKTTYSIAVLEGQPIPVIGAESANGKVEINQSTDVNKPATICAYDASGLYNTNYVINYVLLKKPQDVFGMTRNIVYNLSVSSTPEEANIGPNMLDGDLSTRWAGRGVGEWAVFDLGEVKSIDAFALAYEWGDERRYSYSIEVSEDGDFYTQIYDGASSGTTEDMELVKLANRVNAKYVKLVGKGNTVNEWNGVREFAILTNKEAE